MGFQWIYIRWFHWLYVIFAKPGLEDPSAGWKKNIYYRYGFKLMMFQPQPDQVMRFAKNMTPSNFFNALNILNCTGNALNILNCTGTLPIWCMMAITSTFFSPTTGYHLAGLKASPFHIVICVNICQKTSKKLSNVRLNHQERYIKIPSSSRFHPTISTSHPQTSPPSQHDGTIGSVCPNSISWREF